MQLIDPKKLKDLDLPKEVEEVYLYLKAYSEAPERKAWEERQKRAWRLIENDIWEEDEKKQMEEQKQPAICVNDAVKGVQASCAVQTANRPEIKCLPIGKGDVYVAELLKRGHDLVWEKNENNLNVYEWAEERDIGAIGFMRARLDPNKGPFGKVVNETLEPSHTYFDKDSKKRDFSDTHLIYAVLRSKSYIKEQYDDIKDDDLFTHESITQGGKSSGVTGKDNYQEESKDKPDVPAEATEPENIWEIEASIRRVRDENWIVYQDENGKIQTARVDVKGKGKTAEAAAAQLTPEGGKFISYWPRKREIRELRIIVGKKLIERKEDAYGEDSDGDPICHIIGLRAQRTRTAFPMSPTDYSRDLVRIKNKALMQFIHAQAHNNNAPLREAEGAVRWTGSPGTPGARAMVDLNKVKSLGEGVDRMSSGTGQTTHFLEIVAAAEKSIADQYDAPPFVKGEIPEGTDPSGRLALSVMDSAQTISKPKLGSLEGALVRLAKVNLTLMLNNWPREYWERLLEEDEWTSWMPEKEKTALVAGDEQQTGAPPGQMPKLTDETKGLIRERWRKALDLIRPADYSKPSGISLLDVDVKITAGSSMPTNRMAKDMVASEKFKIGLYDRKAALEYSDDPKAEEIAMRMDQADRALAEMEAQKKSGVKGAV
jgi:hypothetical protein